MRYAKGGLGPLGTAVIRCSAPVDLGTQVVRCGKCAECWEIYATKWAMRSLTEIVNGWGRGNRAWTITLTYRSLDDGVTYGHLQGYWKRTRRALQGKDATLRYMAVAERGTRFKRPHWHAVIVESGYTRRALERGWYNGFSRCRMIRAPVMAEDPQDGEARARRAAWYPSKYLTKDAGALVIGKRRVRASRGWGQEEDRIDTEYQQVRWVSHGWRTI